MTSVALDHIELAREFLRRADLYLGSGDLHQASEKGWGAAVHAAKATAHRYGWEYEHHDQFDFIMQNARERLRQSSLRQYGHSAQALHRNYYKHPSLLRAGAIREDLDDVKKLVDALEPFIA